MSDVCEDYVKIIEEKEEQRRIAREEDKAEQMSRVASQFIDFKNNFDIYVKKREGKKRFKFKHKSYTWIKQTYFEELIILIECHIDLNKYRITQQMLDDHQMWITVKRVE